MSPSSFDIGADRPIYLWGGPGTIWTNRFKFIDTPVDEAAYQVAHLPCGWRWSSAECGIYFASGYNLNLSFPALREASKNKSREPDSMSQTISGIENSIWKALYRLGGIAALLAVFVFRRNLGAEMTAFKGLGAAPK